MMASIMEARIALATAFVNAAWRYWLSVFPRISREAQHWRERAEQIPDPILRRLALEAQRIKRGNLEGAAAFAAFVPRVHRTAVVRAQVAFQAAYDYVDTLAEQPSENPISNGRQLHRALLVALDRHATHVDYYTHHRQHEDNGYLKELVDTCRLALQTLPSYNAALVHSAHRLTARIVTYQSLNLNESHGGHDALARWASKETPSGTALRWWETAASAGSSLGVFALIAAAAQQTLSPTEAIAIEQAYFPWIGSLHSLLDSLIDEPEDTAADQRSLLDHYSSPEETAARLQLLASESIRATKTLPHSHQHTMILVGMAGFYLSAPEASSPAVKRCSHGVLETMGNLAKPTMLILGARHAASQILAQRPTPPMGIRHRAQSLSEREQGNSC
jgi:tetraprenyl-beta-curcumene synthase